MNSLKFWRLKKGYDIEGLAYESGVSRKAIADFENKLILPKRYDQIRLGFALAVPLSRLFQSR